MNKIYRLVWNSAQRVWVVAGEFGSAKGKGKTVSAVARRSGTAVGLFAAALISAPAEAWYVDPSNAARNGGPIAASDSGVVSNTAIGAAALASGEGTTAIGSGAISSGYSSTALGEGAAAMGNYSIALGNNASADSTSSIAIGQGSSASYDYSIAIGSNTSSQGNSTVAIGNSAVTGISGAVSIGAAAQALGSQGVAVGGAAMANSIGGTAIGSDARAWGAYTTAVGRNAFAQGNESVAMGMWARTKSDQNGTAIGGSTDVLANDGTALGHQAIATNAGDVALGANSVTDTTVATTDVNINGTQFQFAGSAPTSTVSVGSVGNERTITNVAAGRVSGTSTDAVNGSQLFATNQAINDLSSYGMKYFHANSTGTDSSATGADAIAIGQSSVASGSNSVTLGTNSTAIADGSIAIGSASQTGYFGAVALGENASALGDQSIAIGRDAQANYNSAIVIGSGAQVEGMYGTAVGRMATAGGVESAVFGMFARTSSDEQGGTAIGAYSNVLAGSGTALGYRAIATNAGDVALGANSVTDTTVATTGTNIRGTDYLFAGVAPTSTVSVGSVGNERTITNVAAGRITDTSTDAINGSQLYATNSAVENIINGGVSTKYFHANSTGDDSSATGADAVAIGQSSTASALNSIAIGNGADASTARSVALGDGAKTQEAVGTAGITIRGNDYTFAGTTPVGTVSVGDKGEERTITNVAAGLVSASSTDAVNGSQLYAVTDAVNNITGGIINLDNRSVKYDIFNDGTTNYNKITLGDLTVITNLAAGTQDGDAVNYAQLNAVSNEVKNISNGTDGMFQVNNTSKRAKPVVTGKDATAGGAGAKASGDNSVALGSNAIATANNSVALGADSIADRVNSVSVGSVGAERQITNVAPGTHGTDAVNVNQLNSGVAQSNQYTDNKFGALKNLVDDNKDKLSAGVAGAMAMASLPQPYAPGASMVSMGGGTYQNQSSVALGVSTISDNGKWVTKLSGSTNSQGDLGAAVGVGYQW